jgi:hypothetical protein
VTARKRPAATEQAVDTGTVYRRNILEAIEAIGPYADRALFEGILEGGGDARNAAFLFVLKRYLDGEDLDAPHDQIMAALQRADPAVADVFDEWVGRAMSAWETAGLVFGLAVGMKLRLTDADLKAARIGLGGAR